MKRLLAKLTGLTAARMFGAMVTFVTTLLITRHFGLDVLGQFALCLSAAGILSVIMPLGLQSLAPISVAKLAANKDVSSIQALFSSAKRKIAWLTGLAALGTGIWALTLGANASVPIVPVMITTTLVAPLLAFVQVQGGILNGLQQHIKGQLPDTFIKPVLLLLLLVSATAIGDLKSVGWILASLATSLSVAAVLQYRAMGNVIANMSDDCESDEPIKHTKWRESGPWLLVSLFWDYHIELLMLVSAFFVNPVEVAILHVCFRIRVLCGFGMKSIYALFQPRIYAAHEEKEQPKVLQAIRHINTLSMIYAVIVISALWLVGPLVLGVFDQKIADNTSILLLVSAVMGVRALFGPAISVLAAENRQGPIASILAISVAISIVVVIAFHASLGITAVAWGYLLSSLFSAVTMWLLVKRETGIDTSLWARPKA